MNKEKLLKDEFSYRSVVISESLEVFVTVERGLLGNGAGAATLVLRNDLGGWVHV